LADKIRWILTGLGLLLIAGIWWRGARPRGQARGEPELREAPPAPPPPPSESREWGVPPLEPLSIKTADFEDVPVLDMPMRADAPPAPTEAGVATPRPAPARTDDSGRFAPAAPKKPNTSEMQKIVAVRVCAPGEARWPGQRLIDALAQQGLAYGRYEVFHRKHADGTSLFCVASLVEPGSFDLARMPDQEFRGVTVFAVLPGPLQPLQTLEALLSAARGLAENLTGQVQDSKGMPLSPQRAAALREEVARFQTLIA
jgi:cell division protein ZipA